MAAIPRASPNWDARPGGVDMLILHYTGMRSAGEAVDRLCDPAARVSSHYVVDEGGEVLRLVDEEHRAWHAGVSQWRGRRGLNDVSIGIEIVNPGHEWGYRPFPAVQIAAVIALCHGILERWPIPARHVVAHSDVAPTRKHDPGELFPWRELAAAGIGIYPAEAREGAAAGDATGVLAGIGYDIANEPLAAIVTAFQRHWYAASVTGVLDEGTVRRIREVGAAFTPPG